MSDEIRHQGSYYAQPVTRIEPDTNENKMKILRARIHGMEIGSGDLHIMAVAGTVSKEFAAFQIWLNDICIEALKMMEPRITKDYPKL